MSLAFQILPPAARFQLEGYFRAICCGKANMDSYTAANLLINSGIPKHMLTRLWKEGMEKSSSFDMPWFVKSMFSITVTRNLNREIGADAAWVLPNSAAAYCDICGRTVGSRDIFFACPLCDDWCCCTDCKESRAAKKGCGHSLPLRPVAVRMVNWRVASHGKITCEKCPEIFQVGDCVYYCRNCHDGDFDLCPSCYKDKQNRCGHDLPLSLIIYSPAVRYNCFCDRCRQSFEEGSPMYHCSTCNDGNLDLCSKCYASPLNHCGHKVREEKNRILGDKGARKQANYGAPSDAVVSSVLPFGTEGGSELGALSKQFGDAKLRDSLRKSTLTEKPQVPWDGIAGLGPAKDELQQAVVLPTLQPHLFRDKRRTKRAILLYGPPGTGKSHLAKAVATDMECNFISVGSSDLMSKWFGDSEGLVRQLFELARESRPSVIFIDEIDSLCGHRDAPGGGDEQTARMKTEFLVQMDGVGNDNQGVFLLAATNRPWELDPAMRRRFQKRIHIPLPDEHARKQLFKIHGGDSFSSIDDANLANLSKRSEGLSGSDIANAVQDALNRPLGRALRATHFKQVQVDGATFFTPCEAEDSEAVQMTWKDVSKGKLHDPPVTVEDFVEALHNFKPSVAKEELEKCLSWTKQYGFEGA